MNNHNAYNEIKRRGNKDGDNWFPLPVILINSRTFRDFYYLGVRNQTYPLITHMSFHSFHGFSPFILILLHSCRHWTCSKFIHHSFPRSSLFSLWYIVWHFWSFQLLLCYSDLVSLIICLDKKGLETLRHKGHD